MLALVINSISLLVCRSPYLAHTLYKICPQDVGCVEGSCLQVDLLLITYLKI